MKCFFGFHKWENRGNENNKYTRVCRRCGSKQILKNVVHRMNGIGILMFNKEIAETATSGYLGYFILYYDLVLHRIVPNQNICTQIRHVLLLISHSPRCNH